MHLLSVVLRELSPSILSDRSDPLYWAVRLSLFVGLLRPTLGWLQEPQMRAAGRWLLERVRRTQAVIQAAMPVPDRRPRPLMHLWSGLAACTLDYLYASYFFSFVVLVPLCLAGSTKPLDTLRALEAFCFTGAMAWLTRFYAGHGRSSRIALQRRWAVLRKGSKRWAACLTMVSVPAGMTLVAAATALLHRAGA